MISISKLYLGADGSSDALRYGPAPQSPASQRPVVVWNVTGRCNLHCRHCYAPAPAGPNNELPRAAALALIDDLAAFGVPALLFSGGEPLLRPDLFDLIGHAAGRGIRCALSTNGVLLDAETARRLKAAGLAYAGISLDGLPQTHDAFRQQSGAFDRALAGVRACRAAGLKAGLRFTAFKDNSGEAPAIMELARQEQIPRLCFYHLVRSGRGRAPDLPDLDRGGTRVLLDTIMDRTVALHKQGYTPEVLTVDNHCDGPYIYLRMLKENSPRAAAVLELLRRNGGNASGRGIGCINWDGAVYPDQFWRSRVLGNVREQPFSTIWVNPGNAFLMQLKEKKKHVTSRCARCRFLEVCAGNMRVRAEEATGDPWAPDPACYLTDKEIENA